MSYTKEEYLKTYEAISYARNYFLVFEELGSKGVLPGFHHLRLGQEAYAAGIYLEVQPNDWVMPELSYHPFTGKTVGLDKWLCELLAKQGGLNGGWGGEAHWFSREGRIGPWSGFVGSSAGVAVGEALAMKMDKVDGCVVFQSGDGAVNEGIYSESLNLAAIWKLPIVFVIDNNGIALSTFTKDSNAIQDLSERGKGFGLPGSSYDGSDVFLVREVMREAMAKARRCEPSVIEFRTTRWLGHFVGDPDVKREARLIKEEREKRDVLKLCANVIISNNIATAAELEEINAKNAAYVRERVMWTLEQPNNTPEALFNKKIFA